MFRWTLYVNFRHFVHFVHSSHPLYQKVNDLFANVKYDSYFLHYLCLNILLASFPWSRDIAPWAAECPCLRPVVLPSSQTLDFADGADLYDSAYDPDSGPLDPYPFDRRDKSHKNYVNIKLFNSKSFCLSSFFYSICHSFRLSIILSVYLLSIILLVYLPFVQSICHSFSLSVIFQSTCHSFSLTDILSVYPSFFQSICHSFSLSVILSV